MDPLLDAILEHVPPPPGDPKGPFAMLVTMTERDLFLGRVATGRIASGQVKVGDKLKVLRYNGKLDQLSLLDSTNIDLKIHLCIYHVDQQAHDWSWSQKLV